MQVEAVSWNVASFIKKRRHSTDFTMETCNRPRRPPEAVICRTSTKLRARVRARVLFITRTKCRLSMKRLVRPLYTEWLFSWARLNIHQTGKGHMYGYRFVFICIRISERSLFKRCNSKIILLNEKLMFGLGSVVNYGNVGQNTSV